MGRRVKGRGGCLVEVQRHGGGGAALRESSRVPLRAEHHRCSGAFSPSPRSSPVRGSWAVQPLHDSSTGGSDPTRREGLPHCVTGDRRIAELQVPGEPEVRHPSRRAFMRPQAPPRPPSSCAAPNSRIAGRLSSRIAKMARIRLSMRAGDCIVGKVGRTLFFCTGAVTHNFQIAFERPQYRVKWHVLDHIRTPSTLQNFQYSTVRSRYKRIVYKRIWVASLPFRTM